MLFPRIHLRHAALSLVALGALTLAACGGASTTAKPTATATATKAPTATATPVLGKSYTSSDGSFSVKYPSSWQAQAIPTDGAPEAVSISTTSGDYFIVSPLTQLVDESGYPDVAKGFAQGAGVTDLNLDTTPSSIPLNNITWTEYDGTMTFNSIASEFSQIATTHNNVTVLIYVIAPQTTAQADATTYFAPMLQSFTFLK